MFSAAFNLLKNGATHDYIGEPISQLEHSLQCAQMAEKQSGDLDMIMAALFHDIGHLHDVNNPLENMQGLGRRDHEKVGARYLYDLGFSEKVAELVGGHVDAKRYMVATSASYVAQLSEASQKTLALQGGPMTASEAANFETDPLFREKLQLRVWDEKAKLAEHPTPSLEYYEKLYRRSLSPGLKHFMF